MKISSLFALALLLTAACGGCSRPSPATPPPPPGPPSLSDAPPPRPDCPADASAASGSSCRSEGQICPDNIHPGSELACDGGAWKTREATHPPCCKK